jgi:hypothetical protein
MQPAAPSVQLSGSTSFQSPFSPHPDYNQPTFSAPSSSSSSSAPKGPRALPAIPIDSHLTVQLELSQPPSRELLESLELHSCKPLDTLSEIAMREAAEQRKLTEPFKLEPFEMAQISSSSNQFAPASTSSTVIIYDLSASPPKQVDAISAFGLSWAPIRPNFVRAAAEQRKRATAKAERDIAEALKAEETLKSESKMDELIEALDAMPSALPDAAPPVAATTITPFPSSLLPSSVASSSTASSSPFSFTAASSSSSSSSSSSADENPDVVQFYSLESALFISPPAAELSKYQARLAQLPAAIKANAAAMLEAESKGELADVGALFVERKRLKAELVKLQSEIPTQADVVEVRDTITLPYGIVTVDKKLVYLMRASEHLQLASRRRAVISNIHPCGFFHRLGPFLHPALGGLNGVDLRDSTIFEPKLHQRGLTQVLGGHRLRVKELLYRGSRDGLRSDAWLSKCLNKGPTFLLMKEATTEQVFGGYSAERWVQFDQAGHSDAFLFSYGPPAKPILTKLIPTSKANGVYHSSAGGPYFGQAVALSMSGSYSQQGYCSSCSDVHSSGYVCAPGFPGQEWGPTTLAGQMSFTLSEFECWAVEEITHSTNAAEEERVKREAEALRPTLCDDCGERADSCACDGQRCPNCVQPRGSCDCPACDVCGEVMDDDGGCENGCRPRCDYCDMRGEDCDCERCEQCGDKMRGRDDCRSGCQPPRCSECRERLEDGECPEGCEQAKCHVCETRLPDGVHCPSGCAPKSEPRKTKARR